MTGESVGMETVIGAGHVNIYLIPSFPTSVGFFPSFILEYLIEFQKL